MSRYCYVQTGAVVEGPKALPSTWTDPVTGNQYSNLEKLSDPELLPLGWYPYVENDTGSPGAYYDRTFSAFTVGATNVTRDVIYVQWDIDRVRDAKNTELEGRLTEYTTQDLALVKADIYIKNESKWLSERQAALASEDDWNTVAAFDTTKPAVLPLPNSFVGESYVNQANRMQTENTAAQANGLPLPWDAAVLSSFVTANQSAATDPSNATAPQEPTYKIRQGIGTRAERFARVIMFRTSRDDPNPSLRTTYKMRLFNRQDNRDLYIFSYTNGTYLTWRKFELIRDAVWGLEATSAEWQYVPGDMGFIFSYGTNPAVEADYFTDRVDFPAGMQSKQILVAWDTQ